MRRFVEHLRREHPHLKVIFTTDALSAKAPYIRSMKSIGKSHFIVGVNPEGNPSLFEWLKGVKLETRTIKNKKEWVELSFYNGVPLNDANHDLEVNFIDCFIKDKNGEITGHFSWITDILVTKENVYELSRGGRARWKIENETFNTLKNQGYHFEHNFGHGYKYLSHIFGLLMFLAFFIDQVQQHCCGLFQAAQEKMISKTRLWQRLRSLFTEFYIDSWADMFRWIVEEHGARMVFNTS
jgi:hypothetical protein